jgi:hypothetical protein
VSTVPRAASTRSWSARRANVMTSRTGDMPSTRKTTATPRVRYPT